MTKLFVTAPNIKAVHGFTTRFGGVSEGVYASLNLGQNRGDDEERVRENYRRVCTAMGISQDDLVCSRQVHGDKIHIITCADKGGAFAHVPREGDALITRGRDAALMVFTADCVPILLHDPAVSAAGAVHAGWRGTALDIAGKTVRKMKHAFGCEPRDVRAAVGPCISRCCFETDGDVPEALYETLGEIAADCIERRGDKYMTDLKEANRLLLMRAGVLPENIYVSDECTACKCEKYWSHRRTNGLRGSQAAIITLKEIL